METKDKEGRTLSEFLAEYDRNKWDRPALTADVVLFSIDENNKPAVLLVRRGGHPYLGCYAFPGGFVGESESSEQAAARELEEETGISGIYLEQFYFVSTPCRDPRGWTVSACYMGSAQKGTAACAADDAAEAKWFNFDYIRKGSLYFLTLQSGEEVLTAQLKVMRDKMGNIDVNATEIVSGEGLAFDHIKLLLLAIERL